MKRPCAILIFDRKTSKEVVTFRPCGAMTLGVVSIGGDMLFAACGRHRKRLDRICK